MFIAMQSARSTGGLSGAALLGSKVCRVCKPPRIFNLEMLRPRNLPAKDLAGGTGSGSVRVIIDFSEDFQCFIEFRLLSSAGILSL
jgi:hypothetical protein